MPDYSRRISMLLGLPEGGEQAYVARLEIDYPDGVHQSFGDTSAKFIEHVQHLMSTAYLDGQRDLCRELLNKGVEIDCPACERPMKDRCVDRMDLSEDVMLCENCRYG